MKIGIDISQIVYEGTGVANYTVNLIENLLKIDRTNDYVLFFSSLRGKMQDARCKMQNDNAKCKIYKIPPTILDFLWNRVHILPIETLIGEIDVFHSSDWTQPPTRAKKITTIHDLTPLKFPETLPPKIVQTHKRRLNWVKKEGAMVICVSKSTQNDVVELLGIPPEKTRVIYEGVSEEFLKKEKDETVKNIKRKYEINGDYILTVGTREPRKNIERLIKAHSLLVSQYPNISLIVAGKYGWGADVKNFHFSQENLLKASFSMTNVQLLGYVPQADLPALYAGARCFVYPSLYEGFGLPVLEAMSVACPVVTSDISSLPEVGGEAAIYCDPYKVESITLAIKKILDLKNHQLERIKEACLLQASKFSWKKAAKETLNLYAELLK